MPSVKKRKARALNIADALGTSTQTSVQVLTLYIPARDSAGRAIRDQRRWVMRAATLLAQIGGGVTILPPVRGGWLSPSGKIIWENTILVYTYVKPDSFLDHLDELRVFLHSLGRETRQGEIVIEFDGSMYRITEYDRR